MKLVMFIIAVLAGLYFFQLPGISTDFAVPPAAQKQRTGSGIKKVEFNELFERERAFSTLAKKGYYTVIEGYINTCTICKRLEADFPAFLASRADVIIRRVHFQEGGVTQSFVGSSQAELERQAIEYAQRLGSYNFASVDFSGGNIDMKICGTPHIEIYAPDKQLIATDTCGKKDLKTGLAFLRNWIRAEQG